MEADEITNLARMVKVVLSTNRVENIAEKEENADMFSQVYLLQDSRKSGLCGNEHFFPFPECFLLFERQI